MSELIIKSGTPLHPPPLIPDDHDLLPIPSASSTAGNRSKIKLLLPRSDVDQDMTVQLIIQNELIKQQGQSKQISHSSCVTCFLLSPGQEGKSSAHTKRGKLTKEYNEIRHREQSWCTAIRAAPIKQRHFSPDAGGKSEAGGET